MRFPLPSVAPLLCFVLLVLGCTESEIGSYRLDQKVLLEASCSGADDTQASRWSASLSESPLESMDVGQPEDLGLARSQARFTRSDASVLFADVVGDGSTFQGLREQHGPTVSASGLGADFAGLLEADSLGCTFDLEVAIEFSFVEGGWSTASGTVVVDIEETDEGENRCQLIACMAEFSFDATHTSWVNPGVYSP